MIFAVSVSAFVESRLGIFGLRVSSRTEFVVLDAVVRRESHPAGEILQQMRRQCRCWLSLE